MGLLDKAKDLVGKNAEKASELKTKAADMVDEKTGGKYADKIDQAEDMMDKGIDKAAEGHEGAEGAEEAAGDVADAAEEA